MFGICLKRNKRESGLVEYIPFLKDLTYSQHVKHDLPVSTSVWSEELLKFVRTIPDMYSPYSDLEKYMISPDTVEKNKIIPSSSSSYFAETFSIYQMIKDKFKKISDEDTYKEVISMNTHGIHIKRFADIASDIIPSLSENYTSSYYRSSSNPLLDLCRSCVINLRNISIVPTGSSYKDIHRIAIKVLKDNWNHNNIIGICCAISDADESSFREMRTAIYEVKPELKGTLKKTEDINDLDLDLFSIEDFLKEEYEFALISNMLNEIVLEEDFLKTSTEILREHQSGLSSSTRTPELVYYTESNISEYVSNVYNGTKDATVYAFLKWKLKPFYKNYDFNSLDYQVCADPGLENMWIIEYSLESKYQFKLYPLDNDESHENLLGDISESKYDFYRLSNEDHTNSIERDRDRICTFTNNLSAIDSIPINLTASQIDKFMGNGTNKILSMGKFSVTDNVQNFLIRAVPEENAKKIIPSAEISVDNTEFLSYFCDYEPILKDDPTILELKELIKGFGCSVPAGNKDTIIKRLAEVMANRYDKVENDIAKMFSNNMIIVKGNYHRTNKEVDICKMLDRDVQAKIISMPRNRNTGNQFSNFIHSNRCVNLVYPCFIVAYIMMHTYAGSIFMPDYKNRLITTKGCFDDLVMRSWGSGENIMMIEASGIGQYSNE